MKRHLLFLFLIIAPTCLSAQAVSSPKTVKLKSPPTVDVEYVLGNGTLGFNRADIRAVVDTINAQSTPPIPYNTRAIENTLALLTRNMEKIVVTRYDVNVSEELQSLDYLFRVHIAATLLRKGKATFVWKSTGKRITEVTWTKTTFDRPDTLVTFTAGKKQVLEASTHNFRALAKSGNDFAPVVFAEPEEEEEAKNYDKVFTDVQQSPLPPGGIKPYGEYIKKEQKYSKQAREAGVVGRVFVKFIVNKDGTLEEFTIIKGLHPDLDQEAIRLLKDGGNWIPGKEDGHLVRVRQVYPVTFELK